MLRLGSLRHILTGVTPQDSKTYCLVLSGGGAKGMYHIGVWRALQELEVPVNAFIGNSIGAIISAFLAQGLYKELEEIGTALDATYALEGERGPQRDLMLITDGEIWDTTPVIDKARNSGHRIFTVGVGSAVAEAFVRELAQATELAELWGIGPDHE